MTNEELYRQYLSGDAEAFERLYLQMQGFIASVAKDAAQSFCSCSCVCWWSWVLQTKKLVSTMLHGLTRCAGRYEPPRWFFIAY
mgnify:CR=1 FL=1